MCIKKTGITCVALSLLLLSGCSSDESKTQTPEEPNQAPSITLKGLSSVDEGEQLVVDFMAVDDKTSYEKLSIEVNSDGLLGEITLDKDNHKILYTAPMLDIDKEKNTGFTISVKDQNGLSATSEIYSITINDKNSPVTASLSTSSNGFQPKLDEKNNALYLWAFENDGNIDLIYDVKDADADIYDVVVDVKGEFNPVNTKATNDSPITITTPLPEIDVPYVNGKVILKVTDNDDTVTFSSNVTIVNKVDLSWDSTIEQKNIISEKDGASFYFNLNENEGYKGDYVVTFTDMDGNALDFDINANLDLSKSQINITPLNPIVGDKNVIMTFTISNKITNEIGENYLAASTIVKNLTIVDDRDDVFNDLFSLYQKNIKLFENIKQRQDEFHIASTFIDYFFFTEQISRKQKYEWLQNANNLLTDEYTELDNQIVKISEMLSTGEKEQQEALIKKFNQTFYQVGKSVREFINDKNQAFGKNNSPFGDLLISNNGEEFNNYYSLYVGNNRYGVFINDDKDWIFNKEYKYLNSANIVNNACF